jgi:hypothetical protein
MHHHLPTPCLYKRLPPRRIHAGFEDKAFASPTTHQQTGWGSRADPLVSSEAGNSRGAFDHLGYPPSRGAFDHLVHSDPSKSELTSQSFVIKVARPKL